MKKISNTGSNNAKVYFISLFLIVLSFGLNAQSKFNFDIHIAPASANWCFGQNLVLTSISIHEKIGSPNAFGYTGAGDSNIVVIYPPSGFNFAQGSPSIVCYPSSNDIYPAPEIHASNSLTAITLSFKTNKIINRDSIVLGNIVIVPKQIPAGDSYGNAIRVTYDTCGDGNTTADKTFNFSGYNMGAPSVTLSHAASDTAYCEVDELVHFSASVSGNTGTGCGYSIVYLMGYKNGGNPYILAMYTGNFNSTAINTMDISTAKLDASYDSVRLALRKGSVSVYSNSLSVGIDDSKPNLDVEFVEVESVFSFTNTSTKTFDVNSGDVLLYNLLEPSITEDNIYDFSRPISLMYFENDTSTYFVYSHYSSYSNEDFMFRFEFDDGGRYQGLLNQYKSEYLSSYCSDYTSPPPAFYYTYCGILTHETFMNTLYFSPDASWIDFSDSTAIIYKELHEVEAYSKYCPIVDTFNIIVLPKPINIPTELCASDTTTYEIRVSKTIPDGYPMTTKFLNFVIDDKVYDTIDSISRFDENAFYYNFKPSEYFAKHAGSGDKKLMVNFKSQGQFIDTNNVVRTIRIDATSTDIYATNYDDFELNGLESVLCYNPIDTFRLTSNYTIDSLKSKSGATYKTYSGSAIDLYLKPSTAYDYYSTWPDPITDSLYLYFKDLNGCYGNDTLYYDIKPAPRIDFDTSNMCIDRYVIFNSESSEAGTDDTLSIYTWNFGDGTTYVSNPDSSNNIPHSFDKGTTTGTNQVPRHKYSLSGEYGVILKIETTEGCEDTVKKTIRVEDVPEPNFEYSHTGLEQNTVEFTNLSVPSDFPTDYTYSWDFDDSHTAQTSDLATPVENTYGQHGIYNVILRATTTNGCTADSIKKVPVFPYVEVTDNTLVSYSFSEGDGWYASKDFDRGTSSGWHLAQVTDNWMDDKHYGGEMWLTGTPEEAIDNEAGWIESPCFDFRSLSFPMISLDIYESLETGRDGAVLQYTFDDGVTWKRLGNMGIGANWYDRDGVYSNPGVNDGGVNVGSLAWSKDTTAWVTARYPLDNIKQESQGAGACVRFRIAYNSNDYHDTAYAGFAVDNFFIGKRKRIVLLEQFINSAFEDANPSREKVNLAQLDDFVDNHLEEVVDIRYHMANSYIEDPLYKTLNNWWDNSARAWEYGAESYGPMWVMDGSAIQSAIWNVSQNVTYEEALEKRALIDPSFDIDTVWTKLHGGSLQISASIKKINAHVDEKLGAHDHKVRFAIVQKYFTEYQGETHRNVLVDLLPNGVGNVVETFYAPYPVGSTDTVTATWTPAIKTAGNNYRLVIYIQGRYNYDEVEQVWFRDLKKSEVPQTTTGVHIPIASGNGFTIYPNPVTDNMQVIMPDGFGNGTSWSIYSMSGQIVSSGMFYGSGNQETISSQELGKGFYVLLLTNKEGVQISSKFSKER